jgi:phage/plasmid-associated DNA primase
LTTARSSGTANSQLASVMFRRFLVVEEPDTMCKSWNWKKFKEITGRGEVQVRELYERSISMMPHFAPILIFNSLTEGCTKVDKAAQRRLEVIPFESEFVHDPTMPYQFPIDVDLSSKFASWKEHLFNILYYGY